MKKILYALILLLVSLSQSQAQRYFNLYGDERHLRLDIGAGVGLLKAGSAYSFSPVFLTKPGIGWNVHLTPRYFVSDKFNIGLKIGGHFRPGFEDTDEATQSPTFVQPKFTPYGMLSTEYYFGSSFDHRTRFYIGLSAGVTLMGEFDARDLTTDFNYKYKRRGQDIFLTVAPKFGVSFSELKFEIEHHVTTPFNPDFTSFNIITNLPVGRQRYF